MTIRTPALLLFAVSLIGIVLQGTHSLAQHAGASQGATAPSALQRYLDIDCGVRTEEGKSAIKEVLAFQPDLLPEFIRILSQGPDKQTLENLAQRLEREWTEREEFIKKNPRNVLTTEDLAALHALTKKEYFERHRRRLDRKYREKAAFALAAFGSAQARQALEAARKATEDTELKRIFNAALELMGQAQ